MFVGRDVEVSRLESHLLQTRASKPTNFLLTGERGIGKSSLLNYVKAVAEGRIALTDHGFLRFLVIDVSIDQDTTLIGLIAKIQLSLERGLSHSEPARDFMSKAWGFLQRVEAAGIKIGSKEPRQDIDEKTFEEFCYSLGDTTNRVCDVAQKSVFDATYDGVLLLIDEADNASDHLRLGAFVKGLTERLAKMECERLMLGLAGLPDVREVLRRSHPSSVRVFEELELDRLPTDDVAKIIRSALECAAKDNDHDYQINSDAEDMLITLSEGYPHFIQQFGYSAFNSDDDYTLDLEDVRNGASGKHGALTQIGDCYYRDDFYNELDEAEREILRSMADGPEWMTRAGLRELFGGDDAKFDVTIDMLVLRGLVVLNDVEKDVYRLQHRGFAFWIKMQTGSVDQLFASFENPEADADEKPPEV
jgi:AAA ATPase domain